MTPAPATAIGEGVKESVSPWPNWFRSTLSAAVGAGIVFAGVLTYVNSIKTDAIEAKKATDETHKIVEDHELRLRVIEDRRAADAATAATTAATLRSLVEKVDEVRADLKDLKKTLK